MHRLNNSERGFTLIELLFAMSFVSIMLIVILTATIQITQIYNKGITLKQVNQSGASIGSELQTSLKAADAPINTDTAVNAAHTAGRLCLGTYSYVWNLQGSRVNQYADSGDTIGMVKVADPTRKMCDGNPGVPHASATELILGAQGKAGVQLELRDFIITRQANAGINYIYAVSYTISTNDHDLIANGACSGSPGDDFCALNSFNFSVFMRKGGSGKI